MKVPPERSAFSGLDSPWGIWLAALRLALPSPSYLNTVQVIETIFVFTTVGSGSNAQEQPNIAMLGVDAGAVLPIPNQFVTCDRCRHRAEVEVDGAAVALLLTSPKQGDGRGGARCESATGVSAKKARWTIVRCRLGKYWRVSS